VTGTDLVNRDTMATSAPGLPTEDALTCTVAPAEPQTSAVSGGACLGGCSVLGGNRAGGLQRLRAVRVTWMRYLVGVALVVAAGLLAACGMAHAGAASGARPWWSQSGSCAFPALVRVHGRVMNVGTCTGFLEIPGPRVTLDLGQHIDVYVTEEGAGPSGNRLVPMIPLPRSSRPSVVTPGAISADRATGTYRAVRPGHAVLMSRAGGCLVTRHREPQKATGSCPVVEITVVPQPGSGFV